MKVPKARKMSSGNWYINLRLGGESINVTEPTEKQCIKTAQLIKAQYLAGKRTEKREEKKLTLTAAIDNYITSRENVLSPSTIRGYRTIQRTRFQSIMKASVSDLTPERCQKAVNDEAKLCSPKTLCNAWRFLSSVIRDATDRVVRVRLPQIVQHERPFLDPAQISVFVAAVKGDDVEVPALLALCSLRTSEIRGLLWENVDFAKGLLHVRGSVVYDEHRQLVRKEATKNVTSRRDVPMIPQLAEALKSLERTDEYVIHGSIQHVYLRVNKICRANNLPEVGLHGLRHSFASLAYHLGMPAKIAQEIGGWANDQTMQRIYTHVAQADRITGQNKMLDYYKNL